MNSLKTLLLLSILASYCSTAVGQFMSSYHESQLIHEQRFVTESRFYQPRSKSPKRVTYVLPNFSLTMISPQLTYGDVYVEETKTLDLTIATESEKDYDLQLNGKVSYGCISYNLNRLRFSLFHELNIDTRLHVPHHLFKLATEGNSNLLNVEINPQALFQSTHKWSLGAEYQLDRIQVGVQANVYTGSAYLNTHSSTMNIDFEENFFEFGFDKDILVESSGAINYSKIDSVDFFLDENALTAAGSFNNLGFGISAQLSFQPMDNLRIFGRVEDLGYIKWTNKTQVLEEQSYEEFGGIDIRKSYVSGETYSVEDTLYSKLEIDSNNKSFSSALLSSFLVGMNYDLNDFLSLGVLLRAKNNGVNQLYFAEPYLSYRPFENTSISVGNFMQQGAPLNPKIALRTELNETFGMHLTMVNPWRIGKYYDTSMMHASLGMYYKFLRQN